MPVDQVQIGMKGYGLTVFHGTKIEPFDIEVVSIVPSDSGPGRAAVWIRSNDPRLAHSGPVMGMSGSPIYLWDPGEPQELGLGGRLIGAFAYAYPLVKECLAGVQPIELMRQVGDRIHNDADEITTQATRTGGTDALQSILALQNLANTQKLDPSQRLSLDTVHRLMQRYADYRHRSSVGDGAEGSHTRLPTGPDGGSSQRLLLPMPMGSADVAQICRPLLAPLGVLPLNTGDGLVADTPPPGIDPDTVELAPGSVLTVPIVFGDIDLSMSGTVTEIRPDGSVLAFGHGYMGVGRTAIPMATGYAHFVVPSLRTSFKRTGSLKLVGSIVQDRNSAVAGISETRFKTAPLQVNVDMPGTAPQQYQYQVLVHPRITPLYTSVASMQSVVAEKQLPIENTMRLHGTLSFTGNRIITIDNIHPNAALFTPTMQLTPVIAPLMDNPFENLELQSMKLSVEIEPERRVGAITHVRIDHAEVKPGQTIRLDIRVLPIGKAPRSFQTQIEVPDDLKEGDYTLQIGGAATYVSAWLASRSHLMQIDNIDNLVEMIQWVMSIRSNAIYTVLTIPDQGLAVGRDELPRLPSSRRAMIKSPTNTLAMPFAQIIEQTIDTDMAIDGLFNFQINVRE